MTIMTPVDPSTLTALTVHASTWLAEQYAGDRFAYHNQTHGREVATAAARLADELHTAGLIDATTARLAPVAGWCHDVEQGPDHEQRSAVRAERWMRAQGMTDEHVGTVRQMILATRVTGVDGHRLVQAADPTDPRQAILADADLSSLGARHGVARCLLLDIEQQGGNPTDRAATLRFLAFQEGLFREHRYLLPAAARLFPHQQASADLVAELAALYAADRIDYAGMLDRAWTHSL